MWNVLSETCSCLNKYNVKLRFMLLDRNESAMEIFRLILRKSLETLISRLQPTIDMISDFGSSLEMKSVLRSLDPN